jgi:Flp pilus assembly protein TadD
VSGGDELVDLDDVELLFDDGAAALSFGIELFVAGHVARSAVALAEAAALLPGDPAAHGWLGRALLRSDPRAAREALRRAVSLRADDFVAWRALALAAVACGDAAAAREALGRALACAPSAGCADGLARDLALAA